MPNVETRARPRPGEARSGTRVTDTDIDAAAANLVAAFQLAGLVAGAGLACPACGTTKPKKVVLRADKKYWKCFRCGAYGGAIRLVEERLGVGFVDAVNLLNGRTARNGVAAAPVEPADLPVVETFRAAVDVEVYEAVLASPAASVDAAVAYYGVWHIDGDVVAEQRARMIVDPDGLRDELVARFGADRLVAAGLAKPARTVLTDRGERRQLPFRLLVGRDYPVVEPQIGPSGAVVNMQFRPSARQQRRIRAHKAGKGRYVPKFLSLAGQTEHHLIGCGLARIATLDRPRTIYVVEGFKDLLAARTMGAEAYAMPGTGVLPPPKVLRFLRDGGHTMLVALDGDDAGVAARAVTVAHFAAAGFGPERLREKTDMPAGMDVCDILVDRHARRGCRCGTCRDWRRTHPV